MPSHAVVTSWAPAPATLDALFGPHLMDVFRDVLHDVQQRRRQIDGVTREGERRVPALRVWCCREPCPQLLAGQLGNCNAREGWVVCVTELLGIGSDLHQPAFQLRHGSLATEGVAPTEDVAHNR